MIIPSHSWSFRASPEHLSFIIQKTVRIVDKSRPKKQKNGILSSFIQEMAVSENIFPSFKSFIHQIIYTISFYESQIGSSSQLLGKIKVMFQTTNQLLIDRLYHLILWLCLKMLTLSSNGWSSSFHRASAMWWCGVNLPDRPRSSRRSLKIVR